MASLMWTPEGWLPLYPSSCTDPPLAGCNCKMNGKVELRAARPERPHRVGAPASNQRPIEARSASVMPVALLNGMIFVTTACW